MEYLVVIRQVTSLTHAHRIQQSIRVGTVPSILVSSILSIAARTHILKGYAYKGLPLRNVFYFCAGI